MLQIRFISLLFLFLGSVSYAEYQKPAHIPDSVWNSVSPYFIPEDHPMKAPLDKLFHSKRRILFSSETLKKAGFANTKPGKWSGTIVARHKLLEGHLVKMYTDDQVDIIEWAKFIDRIKGACAVREAIELYSWQEIFKVPNKWIYPIPEEPAPPAGRPRKNFILLVEDMDLISKKNNLQQWGRKDFPKTTLNAVFGLLKTVGLKDSVYAFNLPFSTDEKIAIVDTEYYHMWPVHYRSMLQYLSPGNREYWKQLINNKASFPP